MKYNNFDSIGAIVITFNPEIYRFLKNINAIIKQVEKLLIVDNNSDNIKEIEKTTCDIDNIDIIKLQHNYGIAKALNEGFVYFQDKHYEWVLTLDQDSICPLNLVNIMKKYNRNTKYGILCPEIKYEGLRKSKKSKKKELENIKACMTSGSLTRVSAWRRVGGFSEEYFIDFVDNDFCEKIRIAGYQIIRVTSISLNHQLGNTDIKTFLGIKLKYSHHTSWRYYYMTRNNIYFIRQYKKRLNLPKECLKVIYLMMTGLFFESDKIEVFGYIKRGIRDALKGKMGEVII